MKADNTIGSKTRNRKKWKRFTPNREFISSAMNDYLKKGGKVTKLKNAPKNQEEIINHYRPKASLQSYTVEKAN